MVTFVYENVEVHVPAWVTDLPAFRRWLDEVTIPDKLDLWYLEGGVWVDLSSQQLFTHILLASEFTALVGLAKGEGTYLMHGARLTNVEANLSGLPDGLFFSHETLQSSRLRLIAAPGGGWDELEGSPDMVLEVVSRSSAQRDTMTLREAYWKAGIREYWLVDGRKEPLSFEILRYTAKGYVSTRKQQGWIKSAVFGKSFRLTQGTDSLGDPQYTLEVR